VLLGLRYSDEIANVLFREVMGMEESATYQAIVRKGLERGLERGRAEGARNMLLRVGEGKFGPPDDATRAVINAMSDLGQLDELAARLATASSWEELVPIPRRRHGRRAGG